MACYNHPDKEAIATCSVCGRPICSDCYVEIGGNSYCKNCLNALINSNEKSNANENVNTNQNQTIENIEPIKKPKTIPYEEEKVDDVPIETPEKIVAPVEKAPENYQPEYDYQTEYVETYGDEDSEDSYYENPETIPEPEPEYKKKMVADPIIPERPKTQEPPEATPNNIESKYERYLEDLYYDEPNYNKGPRNNQYYEEPIYTNRHNNNQVYQERYADDDLDYIVPIHQSNPRNNGPIYEEIKRKIEIEREFGPRYDYYDEPDYGYDRRRDSRQNLDDIQRMHSYDHYDNQDEGFTTVEVLLTVILIILIILVVFYIIYLFALSSSYATFFEAITGLVHDPGLFVSNLLQQ